MDMSTEYASVFVALLMQSPILIIQLIGIGLAVFFWKRQPRTSLLVIIALTLFLFQGVIIATINSSLPVWFIQNNTPTSQIGAIYLGLNVTTTCLNSLAWILLIAALFLQRPSQETGEDN